MDGWYVDMTRFFHWVLVPQLTSLSWELQKNVLKSIQLDDRKMKNGAGAFMVTSADGKSVQQMDGGGF
jgi:hypothetical protein